MCVTLTLHEFTCCMPNIFLICDRIERTAAESKRIAEVKEELTKLDAELATDVAILRKEIEAVSLQYAQIQ